MGLGGTWNTVVGRERERKREREERREGELRKLQVSGLLSIQKHFSSSSSAAAVCLQGEREKGEEEFRVFSKFFSGDGGRRAKGYHYRSSFQAVGWELLPFCSLPWRRRRRAFQIEIGIEKGFLIKVFLLQIISLTHLNFPTIIIGEQ